MSVCSEGLPLRIIEQNHGTEPHRLEKASEIKSNCSPGITVSTTKPCPCPCSASVPSSCVQESEFSCFSGVGPDDACGSLGTFYDSKNLPEGLLELELP